jgi:hypothetical protein
MTTPLGLKDIVSIVTRTEPADDSKLDPSPEKVGITSRYIGEAPLYLQHLWNEYITHHTLVAKGSQDAHIHQMHGVLMDLVALGMRDIYKTEMKHGDTFAITAGWKVHLLIARREKVPAHMSLQ